MLKQISNRTTIISLKKNTSQFISSEENICKVITYSVKSKCYLETSQGTRLWNERNVFILEWLKQHQVCRISWIEKHN